MTSKEFNERLELIVAKTFKYSAVIALQAHLAARPETVKEAEKSSEELKKTTEQSIRQLFLEAIGEDSKETDFAPGYGWVVNDEHRRNALRNGFKQELRSIIKGEK